MMTTPGSAISAMVALLAEGVDRNAVCGRRSRSGRRSPSSRRAWIEIAPTLSWVCPSSVALLAEGVDRNNAYSNGIKLGITSPSSRRAWIEIQITWCIAAAEGRRPPRGGRG